MAVMTRSSRFIPSISSISKILVLAGIRSVIQNLAQAFKEIVRSLDRLAGRVVHGGQGRPDRAASAADHSGRAQRRRVRPGKVDVPARSPHSVSGPRAQVGHSPLRCHCSRHDARPPWGLQPLTPAGLGRGRPSQASARSGRGHLGPLCCRGPRPALWTLARAPGFRHARDLSRTLWSQSVM